VLNVRPESRHGVQRDSPERQKAVTDDVESVENLRLQFLKRAAQIQHWRGLQPDLS
jgi:hypothetical protein